MQPARPSEANRAARRARSYQSDASTTQLSMMQALSLLTNFELLRVQVMRSREGKSFLSHRRRINCKLMPQSCSDFTSTNDQTLQLGSALLSSAFSPPSCMPLPALTSSSSSSSSRSRHSSQLRADWTNDSFASHAYAFDCFRFWTLARPWRVTLSRLLAVSKRARVSLLL